MPELTCYACEREPAAQCPRCGRPYCEEHGEDFCNVCLDPSSGVPSVNLYRGSLLALVVGAGLAIWLILQPGGDNAVSALRPLEATRTPAPAGALTTPPPGSGTQAAATPQVTAAPGTPRPTTPAGAASPTPATSPGANAGVYVVQSGDTLSAICETRIRRPAGMSVPDCVDQIKSLNGLTSDVISIGQQLRVPQ
ncbi:MAG TPA: LysM peptidoglycan-binding domain-containing protein [Dehalococcoidia bacterium]|nr:LysM peptidoglycan-binding domain-containing protein [Dehalococcoidia bacterium]